ncbi:hypothetical protein KAH43_06415 [Candidatus Bipolaricaulota bacterium]|nr:hypothetical protein [Candidatus Bipolaricaulota bacterium]
MSNKRTKTPVAIEAQVLLDCARRCALCYGLDGDLDRKRGQIAHIDRDSSNASQENLVYLCLPHHDEYDSKTSQAKGLTQAELSHYKGRLVSAIASGDHVAYEESKSPEDRSRDDRMAHDASRFYEADSIMSERDLIIFLDQLQSDDSYFRSRRQALNRFVEFVSETGNGFLNEELADSRLALVESLETLSVFLLTHFFIWPERPVLDGDLRLCLYPDLNIDRNGSGGAAESRQYWEWQKQLDACAQSVREAYKQHRLTVKTVLLI